MTDMVIYRRDPQGRLVGYPHPTTPGWVYASDGLGTRYCTRCHRRLRDALPCCLRCGGPTEKIK